jgi:ribosomal protein L11 methylase PrmA
VLYSIRIPWSEAAAESHMARLAHFSLEGVTEGDAEAEVFFRDLAEARAAAELFRVSPPQPAASQNWSAPFQKTWQPLPVGEKFFLIPEWLDVPAPEGRIALPMIAGNVFGGGDHATTQLCLELLELCVQPGARVADVGAGTAILTRAARALRAQAVACDIDPESSPYVDLLGSADALASRSFHLVVANIHLGVLEKIRNDLFRIAAPGAQLLLSGYLPEQRPIIRSLFGPEQQARQRDGWCAALFAA